MPRKIASLSLLTLAALVAIPAQGRAEEIQIGATTRMVEAATALFETVSGEPGGVERLLGFSRKEKLVLAPDDPARQDWSYWPRKRAGLFLDQMDARQRGLVHDLLASVLSSQGYLKVVHIVYLENFLKTLDSAGLARNMGEYALVFFGEPSATEPWGWRFEGHHVSINFSVVAGGLRVTPSFLGANPAEIPSGPMTGFRVLRAEEDLGVALRQSLTEEQVASAVLEGNPPSDILTGTLRKPRDQWDAWRDSVKAEGIQVSELSEAQRGIVHRILREIATNYRDDIAHDVLDKTDLDGLHFAWIGSAERNEPHYYRLQGGDFVFEYDNAVGRNHVHTVWRDRSGDFGADLLRQHYEASH